MDLLTAESGLGARDASAQRVGHARELGVQAEPPVERDLSRSERGIQTGGGEQSVRRPRAEGSRQGRTDRRLPRGKGSDGESR
ncbi:MAG TPA: hypothetical protein VIM50_06150 [Candidatus Limnocylindria bacterium]